MAVWSDKSTAVREKVFEPSFDPQDTQGSADVEDETWDWEGQKRWEESVGGPDLGDDSDSDDGEFTERDMELEAGEESLVPASCLAKHKKVAQKQAQGAAKVAEKAAKAAAKTRS